MKRHSEAFARTKILLGDGSLQHFEKYHILIAGLGGVGGYVAEMLARTGFSKLTLLDHDVVSPSNLNRQIIALHSTIGQFKTDVLAQRLKDINPDIELILLNQFLEKSQANALIENEKYDFVIDCIDSIACKAALIAACVHQNVRIASSMGAGNRLDVTQAQISKLNQTHNCGLARELRATLKKMGVKTNFPVVYSPEHPRQPLPHQPIEGAISGRPRAVNGTIAFLPAQFGIMLAGLVTNIFLNDQSLGEES
jgi:tRNA threonylcarbamoyladenosine dehydratase